MRAPGLDLDVVQKSDRPLGWFVEGLPKAKAEPGVEVETKRSSRHPWAWLLRRVFAVDVLSCERCEGRMRLVEIANTPEELSRVLAKVGLGPRPPPRRRPALPGQLELQFAA